MKNIVFTGMPGCGKSSVSKAVAQKLNRAWFDSDLLIREEAKMTISEIFHEKGEEYFRLLESECIRKLCEKSGVVIALGGGAVLKSENREFIRRNSIVIYIQRSIENIISTLQEGERPLVDGEKSLRLLYESRRAIYEEICDHMIDNNAGVEDAVLKILEIL